MSQSTFLEKLLSIYEYHPTHVRDFIRRLEILPYYLSDKNIVSAILHGSTVRGEFTCVKIDNVTLPLSDIEFAIIVLHHDPNLERNITKKIISLEKSLCKIQNPFFHIDFSFISLSKYRKNPKTLRSFELKNNGITIVGSDIISDIPKVNVKNIDLGDLNEIILVRLWNMLLYLPLSFLNTQSTSQKDVIINYIFHRNALEILTILLPNIGVLIPGFKKRIAYMETIPSNHRIFEYFANDFPNFMKESCLGKLEPQPSQDNLILYEKTILAYIDLIRFISKDSAKLDDSELCLQISQRKLKLHNRKYLKRNAYELLGLASNLKLKMLPWTFHWLILNRRKHALCFLLHMHFSAIYHLKKRSQAYIHLGLAKKHLKYLYWDRIWLKSNAETFVNQWCLLRFIFANFAAQHFRCYKGKEEFFNKILSEDYE